MSQTTEIPFIGVHNTTTENLNENGEVAMSFGLTSNDVAATTTMPAVTHLYHIDGCRILLIHNGSGFKNVFVARPSYDENGEVKKWTTEAYTYDALNNPDETPAIMCSEPGLPNSTAVLGNVVVLNYDDRCRYAFRKNDTYVIRDNTLPPIVFEAAAVNRILSIPKDPVENIDSSEPFDPKLTGFTGKVKFVSLDKMGKQDRDSLREQIYSNFVNIISGWGKYGYVFSPIMIRLAYRLKTGDVVCHTNPVICMPDFGDITEFIASHNRWFKTVNVNNRVVALGYTDEKEQSIIDFIGLGFTPFISIKECADEGYKDLIDSIDVYTSVPIVKKSYEVNDIFMHCSAATYSTDPKYVTLSGLVLGGFIDPTDEVEEDIYMDPSTIRFQAYFDVEKLSDEDFLNVSNFYFAKSIPFDKIELMNKCNDKDEILSMDKLEGFRRVFIDSRNTPVNATADSICTRKLMSDPLNPNAKYSASIVFCVNKRIGMADFFYNTNGISYGSSFFNSYYFDVSSGRITDVDGRIASHHLKLYTYSLIKKDGNYIVKRTEMSSMSAVYDVFRSPVFIAYDKAAGKDYYINSDRDIYYNGMMTFEDVNVTTAYSIEYKPDAIILKEIKFKRHETLNISVSVGNIIQRNLDLNNKEDRSVYELVVRIKNGYNCYKVHNDYIRLSNVGDPYSFDASNTAYFNSPVERVMIVPEAITLGQYGTDQIYVICQDGVYTVGLNDEGKLTRVNTFTSDKIDANRACIAGGQLFVNNGISWDFYQGQNRNQFLSMKRNTAFHFDNLPHILSLNETKQWEWCLQGDNLFDFVQRCTLYYDSINAQIIGVVPNTGFYLVWSKDDGFRMVKSNAEYRVQYNTLLLADNNSNLYDFEATDTVQQDDGMVIMRPFHLNAEQKNGLSTVRSVIVRGNFNSSTSNCAVKIILYGTMDYKTWHVVASSTRYYITGISGTPYAAFRLVILARLKRDEYLSHITVEYDNKESKRLHF